MPLKRTPLHDWHEAHGAKMVAFGGWDMPVHYTGGIRAEHNAVRRAAGLFDVSHMGELRVRGEDAGTLLQSLLTNDVAALEDGQALYSPMCRIDGGTLDDLLVYRLEHHDYLVVVNAGNTAKDFAWVLSHAQDYRHARVEDETLQWSLLAVQGPDAENILQTICPFDLAAIGRFHFRSGSVLQAADGTRLAAGAVVARTGYTGEDGFECYLPWDAAGAVWTALLKAGGARGLTPCGLGARDTLRLEAALPLYGHELTEDVNPLEARLAPFVKLDAGPFVGREALAKVKEEGPARRLVGLRLLERGIAREGYPVFRVASGDHARSGADTNDERCGVVTSGTLAPFLDTSIALARVGGGARVGETLAVEIRGRKVAAEVVKLPFYRRSSPPKA